MRKVEKFIETFSGLTEVFKFYNNEIELRYDVENHEYLLVVDKKLIGIPSVTQIAHILDKSSALLPWACKMMQEKLLRLLAGKDLKTLPTEELEKLITESKSAHRDKKEEAADIGSIAHKWIEEYIKLILSDPFKNFEIPLLPDNEKSANCVRAALDWMVKHNVQWVSTETKVYSRTYKYAGTMDGLAYVDSCDDRKCCPNEFKHRLSLIDWKSSNYLYLEFLLQVAAYQFAYEEESGNSVEDRWIIRLGKENGKVEPWHLEKKDYEEDLDAFLSALDLFNSVKSINERMKNMKDSKKEKKSKSIDKLTK